MLETTSDQDLAQLVAAVSPEVFTHITAYLDETRDAEEAVPYGDLAQAAMEAAQVIRLRRERRA